ncbi:hypothetical protein M8J77_000864 [Diaphorina citri]|nr:hypothetical protein M8J77_000864 [Diaphorina citri]
MAPRSVAKASESEDIKQYLKSEDYANTLTNIIDKIMDKKLKSYIKKIEKLEEENRILHCKVNDLEQYGRRWNLRFFGLEKTNVGISEKNVEETMMKAVNDKLKVNITEKDVEACHFTSKSKKCVIVRFNSRKTRDVIYQNKKMLKGTPISIVEDLTQYNMKLLKSIKEKHGKENVWTTNGKIKYKKNNKIYTVSPKHYSMNADSEEDEDEEEDFN